MDLILWRHAEANEVVPGEDDMHRKLTSKGERQAQRMSCWLDRQLPQDARIFSSPALRAEQTVLPMGRPYKIRDELSPSGTPAHLLELVRWPDAQNTVVVVSHQPLLGQTVAKLLKLRVDDVAIRKGSVWWLRSRCRDKQAQTILLAVQLPEML